MESFTKRWFTKATDNEDPALKCLDAFFSEYIVPYIETLDSKMPDEETVFHIPVMLGGFFAYSSAQFQMKYFNLITKIFK